MPYRFVQNNMPNEFQIIVPNVSTDRRKYIPIDFVKSDTVVSNLAMILLDPQIYTFGIITSHMHVVWAKAVAGRLWEAIRYTVWLCYNTFPFPNISEKKKQLIEEHVYHILDEREKHSEKTLAELYDPDKMPQWLKQAHEYLDEVIEKCYRATPFKNDEDRLAYLFKMYEQMIEEEKSNS